MLRVLVIKQYLLVILAYV